MIFGEPFFVTSLCLLTDRVAPWGGRRTCGSPRPGGKRASLWWRPLAPVTKEKLASRRRQLFCGFLCIGIEQGLVVAVTTILGLHVRVIGHHLPRQPLFMFPRRTITALLHASGMQGALLPGSPHREAGELGGSPGPPVRSHPTFHVLCCKWSLCTKTVCRFCVCVCVCPCLGLFF